MVAAAGSVPDDRQVVVTSLAKRGAGASGDCSFMLKESPATSPGVRFTRGRDASPGSGRVIETPKSYASDSLTKTRATVIRPGTISPSEFAVMSTSTVTKSSGVSRIVGTRGEPKTFAASAMEINAVAHIDLATC